MTAVPRPSARPRPRRRRTSMRRLVAGSGGYQRGMVVAGFVITGAVVVVALFAPLIAPYGYGQVQDAGTYFGSQHGPSARHLFGTTVGGYDVFSRTVWGAQTALEVIVAGTVAALLLGTALGLVAGYLGGRLDGTLVILTDAIFAFPPLLLAIVMSIGVGGGRSGRWNGILATAVTVTILFVPQYFRVVRAETLRMKHEPFVEAAKVVGVPRVRILSRHVLPNATRTLPLIVTLNAGGAVMTLAGLGFVGFGIEPTSAAEWGYDLNRAQSDISAGIWWTAVFPGAAIVLTVLGVTLLGEGLNDIRDPRLRARRGARRAWRAPRWFPPRARLDDTTGTPPPAGTSPPAGTATTAGTSTTAGKPRVPGEREPVPDTARDDELLAVDGLSVTFATDAGEVSAVEDVSLRVRPGEIVAVVGESGSGKSVTARTILGLLPETGHARGSVLVGRQDVLRAGRRQLRRIRGRDIAMIFQEPSTALNPVFPVSWQIAEGIRAHRVRGGSGGFGGFGRRGGHGRPNRRQARERAVELLDLVGIPEPRRRVGHYPHQFSGGQQQRIMITMALALDAPLLIADEPTTALDVTVQAEILDLLRELRDTRDTSIVLITHNMGVVADLADRVLVMREGRLIEEADTVSLFHHPRQDYTRRLLAAVPRIGGGQPTPTGSPAPADSATPPGSATPTPTGSTTPTGSATPPGSASATDDEAVVRAHDLVVDYPGRLGQPSFRAVDAVSFQISRGEVLGLIGESGSGKTTIARAVAGLVPASAGSLRVLGAQLVAGGADRSLRRLRRDIGFVFQDPATSFNPKLTIAACIAEPIVVHESLPPAEVRRRVDDLLESVHLGAGYGDRYPHELSGGQRQRASLARALALRPRLVIADEPTSALDVSVQERVLEVFRTLQRELGFAALFISHDLAVVDALADRVGVLYQGRLVEEGARHTVLTNPSHDYTRRLLAASPVPDPVEQAARRGARGANRGTGPRAPRQTIRASS